LKLSFASYSKLEAVEKINSKGFSVALAFEFQLSIFEEAASVVFRRVKCIALSEKSRTSSNLQDSFDRDLAPHAALILI
jgi:hypothetical protein